MLVSLLADMAEAQNIKDVCHRVASAEHIYCYLGLLHHDYASTACAGAQACPSAICCQELNVYFVESIDWGTSLCRW